MSAKVFISSTSQDLGAYRQAAIETCNRLQLIPIAMEFFAATDAGATAGSKRKMDDSDLYVGIFAHRYGYIEAGYDRSVTEIEYDYAGERGLARLCFLVDPSYPWPVDAVDRYQLDKLDALKAKINTTHIRAQFTTVDDFRAKLTDALVAWKERNRVSTSPPPASAADMPVAATAPPLPSLLIGREKDMQALKARFGINGERKPLTVMQGWPGVGKTTLVTALAYDSDVIAAFPDGVLWASVGENPNPYHELKKWAQVLGADSSQAKTLDEAMSLVRTLLKDKTALLIVDDIWESKDAIPFKLGGRNCATLMTTRFPGVMRDLSTTPDARYVLGILDDNQGMELLNLLAPDVVSRYASACRQLVSDLEGLPLALRVAGRHLEEEHSSGFDVGDTFTALREQAIVLQSVAPDDRFDPHTGTTPTVSLLMKKSTDRLDEHSRECFAFLGAFAPKPATFDLPAMQSVWEVDDGKPIVRKLVDRGLLEPIKEKGRFWMHAVLVMHARALLEAG